MRIVGIHSGPVTNSANGNIYYLLESATWTDSEVTAKAMGGNLVTINDAAEQVWVATTFRDTGSLWIGLSDHASEGTFTWESGEPFGHNNWLTGEPNNNAPSDGEDYVLIWWNGYWGGFAGLWNDITNDGGGYAPMGAVVILP